MEFSHCNQDEQYLTLHDCIATRAYFEKNNLGFEFNNGFWILPEHPESNLSKPVRTDFAKAEYTLEEDGDVTVFIFKKTFLQKKRSGSNGPCRNWRIKSIPENAALNFCTNTSTAPPESWNARWNPAKNRVITIV